MAAVIAASSLLNVVFTLTINRIGSGRVITRQGREEADDELAWQRGQAEPAVCSSELDESIIADGNAASELGPEIISAGRKYDTITDFDVQDGDR